MELFTPQETAHRLKISVRRLHSLCRDQEIEFISLGKKDRRFSNEQIERFIQSRTVLRPEPSKSVDKNATRRLPSRPKKGGGNSTEGSGHSLTEEIKRLCR
jgi:excisionase family DNA binding protein